MRDSFSGPAYVITAARIAAGVDEGREFAPWLVEAMKAKLERENPGLLQRTHDAMLIAGDDTYPAPRPAKVLLVAEEADPTHIMAAEAKGRASRSIKK